MIKKKIKKVDVDNIEYPCDVCGKPAVYNLQGGGYVLWKILRTKNGVDFQREDEWGVGDDTNDFYCEKHARKEKII